MARAIWKGTISFGLVEIPVGLFSAEKAHESNLTMLDKRDFSPIGYKRFNKATQKEVAWDNIVRGREYAKGQYVVLTDTELKSANPAVTQMVQILQFVDADAIEPIFFEKPYYLGPLRKNSKGYVLLRDTLKRTKTYGIARIAVHTREHIAAVGERENALVLYLLRFADEIRSPEGLEHLELEKKVSVMPKELAMAEKLVESMKEEWRPERYKDEYTRAVKKLVETKVASGKVHAMPADKETPIPAAKGKIIDLMPLLKQSIEGTRRAEEPKGPRSTKLPRKKATRARVRRSA